MPVQKPCKISNLEPEMINLPGFGNLPCSSNLSDPLWINNHCRAFGIAGITVRLESDMDLARFRFAPELLRFSILPTGKEDVTLRHHFFLPNLEDVDLGRVIHDIPPWKISTKDDFFFYLGTLPKVDPQNPHRVVIFNADHTKADIYNPPGNLDILLRFGWPSLSLLPTDQIWLAPVLADRQAVLVHSSAVILKGKGLVFVGHSSAGKSTTVTMLKKAATHPVDPVDVEILCDDRNFLRRWPEDWRVHGTWSHGTVSDVSPASAPLHAILFIKQSRRNTLIPLTDRREIWKHLLATLIRPLGTLDWWQKQLDTLEQLITEVPCFIMNFDKSGLIVPELERLVLAPELLASPESRRVER
jgi:hypothetical protein